MYRTSGAATSEIVLERRSRSRVGTTPIMLSALVFIVAMADIVVSGASIDRWAVDRNAAIVVLAFLLFALVVRTPRLQVTRVGREMRIRSGKKESAVLASEVLEVAVDTQSVKAHTVVFVLRGGRRVPVGEPLELMLDAAADRRVLREALLR